MHQNSVSRPPSPGTDISMVELGYKLSSEEHGPRDLVRYARRAEESGFHLIEKYADAGYTHVWVHQIGPDQDGFFDFYASEVLPKLT